MLRFPDVETESPGGGKYLGSQMIPAPNGMSFLAALRGMIVVYDIAGVAAGPFACAFLANRFGLGYIVLYVLLVPAVSYVMSLLVDRWEAWSAARAGDGKMPEAEANSL
jgi:hypothetical protein